MLFSRRPKAPPPAASPAPSAAAATAAPTGLWMRPVGGFAWHDQRPEGDATPDQGPWLRPTHGVTSQLEPYEPLRSRALLPEFLRMCARTQPLDVLQFANRWGSLFAPEGGQGAATLGGSLQQWQQEAWRFRALYEEWEAVASVTRSASADVMRRMRRLLVLRERYQWALDGGRVVYRLSVNADGSTTPGARPPLLQETADLTPSTMGEAAFAALHPDDVVEAARYHIVARVDRRIAGHTSLLLEPQRVPQLKMVADSLLGAIYLMFALEMGQRSQAQGRCGNPRCPNGGQFFKTRRDQRFCDKRCRELASYHRRKAAKVVTLGVVTTPTS